MRSFVAAAAAAAVAAYADDQIVNLPGQPSGFTANMYAGYLPVDANNEKSLFYWHVEVGAALCRDGCYDRADASDDEACEGMVSLHQLLSGLTAHALFRRAEPEQPQY